MLKILQDAIAEVTALPDADQEEIGCRLISHVNGYVSSGLRLIAAFVLSTPEKGVPSISTTFSID
jgi:hypothetical protein